jgi:hypothetical protein
VTREERLAAAEGAILYATQLLARHENDAESAFVRALRRILLNRRLACVCASIVTREVSAECSQWLASRSPLPGYVHVIGRLILCAAAAVRDGRRVWTPKEIETVRAALEADRLHYRAEALAALRLGDIRGVAAATRDGGIIEAIAADLAGPGDPCVVERHAVGKGGKRPRHGTESFEAYERARGVLATLYLETVLVFGCPAPLLAAVLASAATGVAFSRADVRRLQLQDKVGDGRQASRRARR